MLMIAMGVLLGYAIQFFVAIQILFTTVSDSWSFADKHPVCAETIFRVLMVLVTFAVAELVPNLSLLLSLIGSVCCVVLAFVFPVIADLIIRHSQSSGIGCIHLFKNLIILAIALAGFSFGGFVSINAIVEEVAAKFKA